MPRVNGNIQPPTILKRIPEVPPMFTILPQYPNHCVSTSPICTPQHTLQVAAESDVYVCTFKIRIVAISIKPTWDFNRSFVEIKLDGFDLRSRNGFRPISYAPVNRFFPFLSSYPILCLEELKGSLRIMIRAV
jgi:hypothetical protein